MNDDVVNAILSDWRSAPIDEKLRAILGFLEKVTLTPTEVSAADIISLREAGLNHGAVEEALYVCFLFNLMNRLADAFDFPLHDKKGFGTEARLLYRMGYGMASIPG